MGGSQRSTIHGPGRSCSRQDSRRKGGKGDGERSEEGDFTSTTVGCLDFADNMQRAKQGLAPTKILPRLHTPAMHTLRSQPSTSTLRKREAPTPTPLDVKRQRTAPASSIRTLSNPPRASSRDPGSSPTPGCGIPRPVSNSSRTASGQSASSVFSTASTASDRTRVGPITWSSKPPLPGVAILSKAEGRRPKRESFKPRQSVVGNLFAVRAASGPSWGLVVEEEEGGEDDVF